MTYAAAASANPSHGPPEDRYRLFRNRTQKAAWDEAHTVVDYARDSGEDLPLPGRGSQRFWGRYLAWYDLLLYFETDGKLNDWEREREAYLWNMNAPARVLTLEYAREQLADLTLEEREARIKAGPIHTRQRLKEETEARRAENLRRLAEEG